MEHTQQYETEHLKKVQDKLAAEIKELNAQLGDKQEEIVRMKKYFWENCNEFDEFGYEHYTNRQMIQNEIDMAEDRMKKAETDRQLRMAEVKLKRALNRIDNVPLPYEGLAFTGKFLMENGLEIPLKHNVDYHKQDDWSSRVLYLTAE